MSQDKCLACGEPTVFEEELGSSICVSCGTLSNPSQTILQTHLEHIPTDGRDLWRGSTYGTVLKGANGWGLAGQSKAARNERNKVTMHVFIETISSRLSSSSVADRAKTIFDQAMSTGQFNWGRKAKLLSGAALSVALRESNKRDSLQDIAYLIEVSLGLLKRMFKTVVELLHLGITIADPAQHLPVLQTHLNGLLQDPKVLSRQLRTFVAPLQQQMPALLQTAKSLSNLVSRNSAIASLPTAATACAILMLSAEGELASLLPKAGEFAEALATRVGATKVVVMGRYKIVHDLIEEYIRDVPWLNVPDRRGKPKTKLGKGKRAVAANGLKDVVQFQEELWKKKLDDLERPMLSLELDSTDGDDGESVTSSEYSSGMSHTSTQPSLFREDVASSQLKKSRKSTHARSAERASQFLLNPLGEGTSADGRAMASGQGGEGLFEYFLAADDSTLSSTFKHPPSRLQAILIAKGEHAITDEELFEEGELESVLRTPEEVEVMRRAMEWSTEDGEESGSGQGRKRQRASDDAAANEPPGKRSRIDKDALARILESEDAEYHVLGLDLDEKFGQDDVDFEQSFTMSADKFDEDDQCGLPQVLSAPARHNCLPDASAEEEIVEEWRPLSPGGGGGYDEDRYEF